MYWQISVTIMSFGDQGGVNGMGPKLVYYNHDSQVQIQKKGKNKNREEIFYQMKGFFFVKISCKKCFL